MSKLQWQPTEWRYCCRTIWVTDKPLTGTVNKPITHSTYTHTLHFNGHFPGGPALAGNRMSPFWILLELTVMEVVVTTGTVGRAKLQSNHHHQQTKQRPAFYRPDALPVAQPTVSEHWRESAYNRSVVYTTQHGAVLPSYHPDNHCCANNAKYSGAENLLPC